MELNDLNVDEDLKFQFDIVKPICRCCLSTDRRMIQAVDMELLFKDLANIDVSASDGLPQWVCWECAAFLRNSVRFKQKMLRAHTILFEYSSRCAPFPIDAEDPELSKNASPQLFSTTVLAFELGGKNKVNSDPITHEKFYPATELDILPNISLSVFVDKTQEDIKNEIDFVDDYDYDENMALNEYNRTKFTDDDINELLNETGNFLAENVRKKKKVKKKDLKNNKKRRNEEIADIQPNQMKASIRRTIDIDPDKIRIITLNPEEQIKQREAESQSGVKFPFQCKLCFKGFNYQAKLDNHMVKHSPSRGSFECKLCHMYLPTSYSYNVHNLIHTQRYECRECGRRMIDKASIVDHYRTQHEGQLTLFTCEICGKESTNNKTHRSHMRNRHGGERPECDQCGKSFVNKDGLAEHIMSIHQDVKNYACPTCFKQFRTRSQVKVHQMTHADTKDAKDYYCVECDVIFKTANTLRQHLQKSLKHKDFLSFQFVCAQCSKRFETSSALRSHTLVQHEGVRSHRCPQCPSALATRASLAKHLMTVHRGRRPPPKHVCDTCGKAFRGKSVLTNHVRTHTGEKPFTCSHCGRGFTQRTSMYTHVKLVHLKIRKRPKIKPEVTTEETKVFQKTEPAMDAWGRPHPPDLYSYV